MKLTKLRRSVKRLGQELETANLKTTSAAFPAVLMDQANYVGAYPSLPVRLYRHPAGLMVRVIEQLRQQLSDNEIRKKLLKLSAPAWLTIWKSTPNRNGIAS